IAVCQPSVPVMAAVARMEADDDPCVPHSMVLMGGPIDTRVNPTEVNTLAERRGTDWFRRSVITKVPFPNPGFMRDVYPGFLQLNGFVSMNLERHIEAHRKLFQHLVAGDGDSAQKHREFYDEYLAVMDLTAEFYLQTVETVFVRHALPNGQMTHRGLPVDPAKIRRVALLTVEGENDDISGVGQTEAAHRLCVNIPAERKAHWLQPSVGHYGVFNGSRFRAETAPRIADFILSNNGDGAAREVVLTMPPPGSVKEARVFAQKHGAWIAARLKRLPAAVPFAPGTELPLRGVPHRIVHRGGERGTVWTELDAHGAPLLCVAGEAPHVARRMGDFLRRAARRDLDAASRRHAAALGVVVKRIAVRDQSSRWGSCSNSGVLSFSWRLIFAPPFVLDYLAAHEVAHLVELNHSPRFWRLVAKLSADTERAKA